MATTLQFLAGLCLVVSSLAQANFDRNLVPDNVFNVRDFGAKGDGVTLDWQAILNAFDAATQAGGGTVTFPSGTYLTGPLNLTANTRVEITEDATILASGDKSLYPMRRCGILCGANISNVEIFGGGLIDGAGKNWWPVVPTMTTVWPDEPTDDVPEPFMLMCTTCDHVWFHNIRLLNSPFWNVRPYNCSYWTISEINIWAPINSPNTDCIDPDSSNNFLIENSVLACGDDHVSVKSSSTIPTYNIMVRNVTYLHGQGMTIGSAVVGGVRNVTFKDSTMIGGLVGMRFKAVRNRGGYASDITFENLSFQSVAILMSINMDFDHNPDPKNVSLSPVIEDVKLRDISGWGVMSMEMHCLDESPCRDFDLQGVNTVFCQNFECANMHGTWSNCSHPIPCSELKHVV